MSAWNPFKSVWISPRETVRRIISENPSLHVTLLVCLYGIGQVLGRASMKNLGDRAPLELIIPLALILGPLMGLLSLWIFSHLIRVSGIWLRGIGNREHIKAAMAWGYVPSVFALVLWIPELFLFGVELFTEETPRIDADPLLWNLLGLFLAIEGIFTIWSVILISNSIAEVQGFRSAWRGFGNLLLAIALFLVPLLLIGMVVVLVTR